MDQEHRPDSPNDHRIPIERTEGADDLRHSGRDSRGYAGDLYRSRVSWGAIFAGTVVGLAVLSLLTLLGMAVGLSAVTFGSDQSAFQGIPLGAGIWLAVSQLVALGIGGFVAGRLAGIPKAFASAVHGLAVWSLASLLLIYAATSAAGTLIGGAGSLVGSIVSGASSVVQAAAPAAMPDADTRARIEEEATSVVNEVLSSREQSRMADAAQSTATDIVRDPAAAREEIADLIEQVVGTGGIIGADDRRQAATILSQRTGMSQAEAEASIERWQTQIVATAQTAGSQATSVGNNVADLGADIALLAFVASVFGLIAATGAALLGRPALTEPSIVADRRDSI